MTSPSIASPTASSSARCPDWPPEGAESQSGHGGASTSAPTAASTSARCSAPSASSTRRPCRSTATYDAPLLSSHNHVVVTERRLLVAAGDEAVTAIDTVHRRRPVDVRADAGQQRLQFDRRRRIRPGGSTAAARSAPNAALNIGRVGRLEERDLATGLPTGVVFDPQQGTAGDVAVTADERELVIFSHNAPVISHWRLDGTGPVTTRVGQGAHRRRLRPHRHHDAGAPQPSGAELFEDEPDAAGDDRYIWDPVADQMIDPLDDVVDRQMGRASRDAGRHLRRRHSRPVRPDNTRTAWARPSSSSTVASPPSPGRRTAPGSTSGTWTAASRRFDSSTGDEIRTGHPDPRDDRIDRRHRPAAPGSSPPPSTTSNGR